MYLQEAQPWCYDFLMQGVNGPLDMVVNGGWAIVMMHPKEFYRLFDNSIKYCEKLLITQDKVHFDTVRGDIFYYNKYDFRFISTMNYIMNDYLEDNFMTCRPWETDYAAAA